MSKEKKKVHSLIMTIVIQNLKINMYVYKKFFQMTIKVKYLNNDYDNFVAIDDISYEATFCSEAKDAWDLGSDFYSVPMLSALLQRPIFSSKVILSLYDAEKLK